MAEQLTDKIPVFGLTDDGRDVDDVEAFAYLEGAPEAFTAAIATTHMIPDRRAMIARAYMAHLGRPDVPIGVGSVFPIGKDDEALVPYLRAHTIQGRTYEGDGLIECFPSAEEVLVNSVRRYGKRLQIAAFAPLTELAKVMQSHPGLLEDVGGIYIQGQATVEGGELAPDLAAYNLKEDPEAAHTVFGLQHHVPFTFVGKHAAYLWPMPLTRNNFNAFAATGNPAGTYLKTHAIKGIECFAERDPDIFKRVFGVDANQVGTLQELSKPYDALVAMSITSPELFAPIRVGRHALIGMDAEHPGIINPVATKAKLIGTIMRALTANRS